MVSSALNVCVEHAQRDRDTPASSLCSTLSIPCFLLEGQIQGCSVNFCKLLLLTKTGHLREGKEISLVEARGGWPLSRLGVGGSCPPSEEGKPPGPLRSLHTWIYPDFLTPSLSPPLLAIV